MILLTWPFAAAHLSPGTVHTNHPISDSESCPSVSNSNTVIRDTAILSLFWPIHYIFFPQPLYHFSALMYNKTRRRGIAMAPSSFSPSILEPIPVRHSQPPTLLEVLPNALFSTLPGSVPNLHFIPLANTIWQWVDFSMKNFLQLVCTLAIALHCCGTNPL